MQVWVGDRLVEEADACVRAHDHGLTVGDGVFETLRVYGGRAFALRRHLERLAESAAGLGLPLPDTGLLRTAVAQVVETNGLSSGAVRITLTSGPGPAGSLRGDGPPTLVVAAAAIPPWPATADVVVVPWPRNERGALSGLKTTSYGENVVALHWAAARGASEAVFANLAGNLCEGTGSNVFVVVDGRLVTPPLIAGCLAGVTRDLVVRECGAVEEDLPVTALLGADEAFLTSTTREVQPIRAVDGRELPAAPGPLTTAAMEALVRAIEGDPDP